MTLMTFFKVMGSKVKVIDSVSEKNTFPAETCGSAARCRIPSSSVHCARNTLVRFSTRIRDVPFQELVQQNEYDHAPIDDPSAFRDEQTSLDR